MKELVIELNRLLKASKISLPEMSFLIAVGKQEGIGTVELSEILGYPNARAFTSTIVRWRKAGRFKVVEGTAQERAAGQSIHRYYLTESGRIAVNNCAGILLKTGNEVHFSCDESA